MKFRILNVVQGPDFGANVGAHASFFPNHVLLKPLCNLLHVFLELKPVRPLGPKVSQNLEDVQFGLLVGQFFVLVVQQRYDLLQRLFIFEEVIYF